MLKRTFGLFAGTALSVFVAFNALTDKTADHDYTFTDSDEVRLEEALKLSSARANLRDVKQQIYADYKQDELLEKGLDHVKARIAAKEQEEKIAAQKLLENALHGALIRAAVSDIQKKQLSESIAQLKESLKNDPDVLSFQERSVPILVAQSKKVHPEHHSRNIPLLASDHSKVRYNVPNTQTTNNFTIAGHNAWDKFLNLIKEREGFSETIYNDRGHLAIGVGHNISRSDVKKHGWKIGDTVPKNVIQKYLEQDTKKFFKAALAQSETIGITNPDFVAVLASVNFQNGVNWHKEHKRTWSYLTQGRLDKAAEEVNNSLWAKQTPKRSEDFRKAILHAGGEDKFEEPVVLASAPTLPRNG